MKSGDSKQSYRNTFVFQALKTTFKIESNLKNTCYDKYFKRF